MLGTVLAVSKRFVFAVFARTLAGEHFGPTLLRSVLRRVIELPSIVAAPTTTISTAIVATRAPAIITTLATRLPLTTRSTIITTRSPAVVTTLTTRTPTVTVTAAIAITTSATETPSATGRSAGPRTRPTSRTATTFAAAKSTASAVISATVVVARLFLVAVVRCRHGCPTLRRHSDCGVHTTPETRKTPAFAGVFR